MFYHYNHSWSPHPIQWRLWTFDTILKVISWINKCIKFSLQQYFSPMFYNLWQIVIRYSIWGTCEHSPYSFEWISMLRYTIVLYAIIIEMPYKYLRIINRNDIHCEYFEIPSCISVWGWVVYWGKHWSIMFIDFFQRYMSKMITSHANLFLKKLPGLIAQRELNAHKNTTLDWTINLNWHSVPQIAIMVYCKQTDYSLLCLNLPASSKRVYGNTIQEGMWKLIMLYSNSYRISCDELWGNDLRCRLSISILSFCYKLLNANLHRMNEAKLAVSIFASLSTSTHTALLNIVLHLTLPDWS